MVSHRRARRISFPAIRGLLLSFRDLLVLALCAVGLLTAWLVYGVSGTGGHSPIASGDSTGTVLSGSVQEVWPSALVPTATPTGVSSTAPPAVSYPAASPPQRVTYPAAGMDVVVNPLAPDSADADSHSIEPPETMDAYWLTPFGTPGAGSTNTTYVIGHSWIGLDAPFNHLSSAAAAGDEITVTTATGTMTYRVDSVTTYTKATLKDSPIWAVAPNRLVLISCYTEDPWGKNVAVVASPVPAR
ncbi:sortase [Arthrobacter sp. 24S4-2]|uniref:class F sortase n=1 Tax=Arthrobacter sp. 24S4-2 TaxID=2575374 RepID=UPI0010C793CD|nr:class F sortase [Arthrobacter sp. 24S4-2]QCO99021.1 sortase [Arthrobacter sp. 24S4-2]